MPAHVDHQHVLRLEGLLLSRAILPPAHKLLLLPMDVVIVDVLRKKMTELEQSNLCIIIGSCCVQCCFALNRFVV